MYYFCLSLFSSGLAIKIILACDMNCSDLSHFQLSRMTWDPNCVFLPSVKSSVSFISHGHLSRAFGVCSCPFSTIFRCPLSLFIFQPCWFSECVHSYKLYSRKCAGCFQPMLKCTAFAVIMLKNFSFRFLFNTRSTW